MEQIDEVYRTKIATFMQAMYAAKYAKEDNVPCQIEEGLFLGSVGVAYNKDALKGLNVTHILIVAKSLEPAFPNDFIYKKIEVLDSSDTNLEQHFDECFDFIEEAKRLGGGALVHCFAGRSRSVTVIIAYLMKKHHMSLSQAMDLVRSKRPQVAPNQGFMLQLQNYEKSLRVIYAGLTFSIIETIDMRSGPHGILPHAHLIGENRLRDDELGIPSGTFLGSFVVPVSTMSTAFSFEMKAI